MKLVHTMIGTFSYMKYSYHGDFMIPTFQVFSTKLLTRFRDIFDDYVIGMKEAVEAEEGAKDK